MHPRLRRFLAGAGVICLALSAICLTSDGALRAAPLLGVRLTLPFLGSSRNRVAKVASPAPEVSPAGRRRGMFGDGPVVFKGTGTYQLSYQRSSRNGLTLGSDNYSTALSVVAERRTERSSLSVSNAFGYGGGTYSIGTLIAGYRTPQYGLTYGQVTSPADTQLQIGGFARGIALSLPVRNGQLTYLAGTAAQQTPQFNETFRVYGVRRDWSARSGFFGAGAYYGTGEQGIGRELVADLSFRRFGAKLSTDTEIAVSAAHGIPGVPEGPRLATAFRADLQGAKTFTTLALKFDPAGFQTLTGPVTGAFSADLALRRHSERLGEINLELLHSDERLGTAVQHDDRATLSGGRTSGRFGLQYVAGLEGTRVGGTVAVQRTGALTFSETFGKLSLFETYQSASTNATNGSAAQRQLAIGAARPMLGGSLAYQFALSDSNSSSGSTGSATSQALSYRRALGRKLDLQIAEALQASTNNGVLTRLNETSITLVRRLSNVVAIQVSADRFHQTGIGGGSGTTVSASLVGPFGFGEQLNAGRANPNMPAVIRGLVTFSTSPTPFAYNAPAQHGYNNALVVLDGKITQRTDSTGQFEFRFVPQGTHTIRVDAATIAPGLIVDREYQTVRVLGGQTTTLQFNVGNFAGVTGVVSAQDARGVKRPLVGIGVAVDGVQAVTTTADGHYQIGRLNPGAHTIEIVDATVPSTVQFLNDRKRTVTVAAGNATTINFLAVPLGSIAGMVVAPADGGFGNLVGLKNVYVVAQPGERAAITDEDGSFLIDNVPPGSYTLSLDADTIPEGLTILSGPDGPVSVDGGGAMSGIMFKLGAGAKNVVYTFNDGRRVPIQVEILPEVAPPGALLRISAHTAAKDVAAIVVESDVFGTFPLHRDAHGAWLGTATVPSLAKGDYALTVTAHRKDVTDGQALVPVDPRIPLFALRLNPLAPAPRQTAHVTLKALGPAEEGDTLLFEDGYKIVLPRPRGRVFSFDVRIWGKGLPYSATLVTKRGPTYPISLR